MRQALSKDPYFARREDLDISQMMSLGRYGGSDVTVGRFSRQDRDLGVTEPNPESDQLMVVVHLKPLAPTDIWREGCYFKTPNIGVGGLKLLDQRRVWRTHLRQPFETFNLFIPNLAFRELSEQVRAPVSDEFNFDIAAPRHDPVMLHLALSLLPALAKPRELNRLFTEHVFTAMRLHLAQTYGGLRVGPAAPARGLTAWQEARVKEMLLDDPAANRDLTELAHACGVSVSHFVRLFKASLGAPPHRWLMERRIERAKQLMSVSRKTLSDIATECGFSDQSHLSRVFKRATGVSPGAWRRLMGQQ